MEEIDNKNPFPKPTPDPPISLLPQCLPKSAKEPSATPISEPHELLDKSLHDKNDEDPKNHSIKIHSDTPNRVLSHSLPLSIKEPMNETLTEPSTDNSKPYKRISLHVEYHVEDEDRIEIKRENSKDSEHSANVHSPINTHEATSSLRSVIQRKNKGYQKWKERIHRKLTEQDDRYCLGILLSP